ncbi:MAG: type I pullulanase [Roseburia sp.]|nr:type I pullulanase [Roseburia sp.]
MRQRIRALLLGIVMFAMTIAGSFADVTTVKAAEDLTLKLHYHRADGNYDGWDVWLWEEGGDGNAYAFEEEDGEMVATKVIAPGVSSVGFIVRTADWTKDINEDQFIDISEMVSGTVHIYVESGKKGYTKEYGEDAVTGTKLLKARYEEETQMITVQMTGKIDGDFKKAFSILGTDGEAAITEVTEEAQFTYLISVERPLDLTKNYNILFDGNEYKIIMPNIYSTESFEEQYTYTGTDLGATWSSDKTSFRVWAPTAEAVKVNLYASGTEGTDDLLEEIPMQADVNGTWIAEKEGDANGIYYTYTVTINGEETEACDPYARTTGVNGKRAMIIDLASTNPQGWESDANPHAGENITDAVIYELHVRDLSSDESAGIQNVGKFLGVIETGTTTESGIPTGLDHIKDLGITHLHLLPSYDYGSVDETKLDDAKFNWGYDPVNYNVPEGSYSTDPYHGEVRVKEMKQMVQGLHENGISVVMDVVYNHVYNASEFCFNKIVPGYFSRMDEEGKYSNGSGCGNDTASERAMVHKYIVDSVKYWAEEYHIDGFRFDLVGLIDTETINEIVAEVHKDYPDVIFYGEGWTMDTSVTKDGYLMATQLNSEETPDFAYFNDTMRDGLKGNVFENSQTGYVSGAEGLEETITQCFLGAADWCPSPSQTVNYASCHDNLTLMDRLSRSALNATREERIRMNNLSAAIYMTAQGIPFMQAGEEMLRTKLKGSGEFDENSYASPDSVNSLKWDTLNEEEYQNTYNYYKGLIAFRSAHPALRMMTAEDVAANIMPVEGLEANVTAFDIKGGANGDSADGMFVIFNPNQTQTQVTLPEGVWDVYINGEKAGTEVLETITEGTATVAPISAMVLIKGEADAKTAAEPAKKAPFAIGVAAVAAVVAGVVAFMRKKKK